MSPAGSPASGGPGSEPGDGPRDELPAWTGGPGADPLRHHGDAEARGARIDFAVNVLASAPPPFIQEALRTALEEVAAYPDEAPARHALAAALGVGADAVLLVNGVSQAFMLVAQAGPGYLQPGTPAAAVTGPAGRWRRPVVVHPQFTEPEAALAACGHQVGRVVLTAETGFGLTGQACAQIGALGPDLLVIGNPVNPTGRLHEAARLRMLLRPGRTVLIDEAFIDVVPGERESLLAEAATTPGLLVARSLTKTFALAGVRAGFLVGEPESLARLRALQPPWSVNCLALAATRATLGEAAGAFRQQLRDQLPARREHLTAVLAERGWQVVTGGQAPFLLARHPQAAAIRAELRRRGIAVRRGDTFPGLDGQWARFALRPAPLVAALAAALDEITASGACPGHAGDLAP